MKSGFQVSIMLAVLSFTLFQSCTTLLCVVCGENPVEIMKTCETPEPGTYIDPVCNLIAVKGIKYFSSPDSLYNSRKKLLKLIKPSIRYSADTLIETDGYKIPARIYCNVPDSKRKDLPVIVYYHGGGFIWGTIETFDGYCRKLSRVTGGIVIAPEYRLAPEFPYPYPINDSYDALEWVYDNAASLGGDPARLFVMGGSAGGNIAAVMALKSADNGGPPLRAQILCYPATTFEETLFPSREYFLMNDTYYLLNLDFLNRVRENYLLNGGDEKDPYVSPLLAEIDEDLPQALIITAIADPLRDEGRLYAEKLEESGIDVKYWECEGMIHSFLPFYPILNESRFILREIARYINDCN